MAESDRTRYIEIDVHTALTRVDSAQMPSLKWSLNPYRGCKHGCVYCYARYTHTFLELDPDVDFSGTVFVKRNLVQALRSDLRRSSWRREHVNIGTATDPYQPAEGRYQLTRGVLEVLAEQLTPASLVTKNTMALRDAEVMARLAHDAGFHLIMTITTLDEALARQLEPDVPSPQQRLRVVSELAAAGVPVSVGAAPVLPGLTDTDDQLAALFQAAYDHGAEVAFHQPFRMYAATRATLFSFLAAHYPHLLEPYRRSYAFSQDPPPDYRRRLRERVQHIRQRLTPPPPRSAPSDQGGQLRLNL